MSRASPRSSTRRRRISSRSSATSAAALACEEVLAELARRMNAAPEELVLRDGVVSAGSRTVPLADLVRDAPIVARGRSTPGQQAKRTSQASHGAHFAEVAVNAVTGEVRVRRMVGVFDVGRVLNVFLTRNVPDDDEMLVGYVRGETPERTANRYGQEVLEEPAYQDALADLDGVGGTRVIESPTFGETWVTLVPVTNTQGEGSLVIVNFLRDEHEELDRTLQHASRFGGIAGRAPDAVAGHAHGAETQAAHAQIATDQKIACGICGGSGDHCREHRSC